MCVILTAALQPDVPSKREHACCSPEAWASKRFEPDAFRASLLSAPCWLVRACSIRQPSSPSRDRALALREVLGSTVVDVIFGSTTIEGTRVTKGITGIHSSLSMLTIAQRHHKKRRLVQRDAARRGAIDARGTECLVREYTAECHARTPKFDHTRKLDEYRPAQNQNAERTLGNPPLGAPS